jgi:hypothetical protein
VAGLHVCCLQLYVSHNYGESFSSALPFELPWAAVSVSRGGFTIAAVAASDTTLARMAVQRFGKRTANKAQSLLREAKQMASQHVEASIIGDPFRTVWISSNSGATFYPANTPATHANRPSSFTDVALSADGLRLVAVQRGTSDSSDSGIYTATIQNPAAVKLSGPLNYGK